MHIEANVCLLNSSYTMNYGGFIWSMSNLYLIMKTQIFSLHPMLLFRPKASASRHLRPYLNHEDAHVLTEADVIIQTH